MSERILARVGALTVTEAEVDEFIMGMGARGAQYNTPEGRRAVLTQIINNKLFLLDAQRNLYEAEAPFRAELAKLKEQLLIRYATDKALASATVSEAEVRAYYDENRDKFNTGESVNASHVLVATEEEALAVLSEIQSGAITFEQAAQKYSSCPSKENGGNLGDFGRGQMVPEFDAAVFAMAEGEVSAAPVKTQFGYHLIKLNSKSEGKVLEYAEVHDDLYSMMLSDKQNKAYTSKVNQLKIMYPVDMLTV